MRWLIVQRSTTWLVGGGDERRRCAMAAQARDPIAQRPSRRPTRRPASVRGPRIVVDRGHGVVGERADQRRDRPGQEAERSAVDDGRLPGPVEVEPRREPEVQSRRGDQEEDRVARPRRRSPAESRST